MPVFQTGEWRSQVLTGNVMTVSSVLIFQGFDVAAPTKAGAATQSGMFETRARGPDALVDTDRLLKPRNP